MILIVTNEFIKSFFYYLPLRKSCIFIRKNMKKVLLICLSLFVLSCQNPSADDSSSKEQIIQTLNNETRYFCERNLEKWQEEWAHQPYCSKMYAGNIEFEELLGWEAIRQFAVEHIAENPQPFPLPDTNFDYDIYLFGETAWVFYFKTVDNASMRETRFMVKEGNKWKIAKMQTIY